MSGDALVGSAESVGASKVDVDVPVEKEVDDAGSAATVIGAFDTGAIFVVRVGWSTPTVVRVVWIVISIVS